MCKYVCVRVSVWCAGARVSEEHRTRVHRDTRNAFKKYGPDNLFGKSSKNDAKMSEVLQSRLRYLFVVSLFITSSVILENSHYCKMQNGQLLLASCWTQAFRNDCLSSRWAVFHEMTNWQ